MSEVAPSTNAGQEAPNRSTGRYASYVFWIMFNINLLNYLDRYVFIGASNVIGKELGLGIDQIGELATMFIVVYALATLPLGIWADRSSRKNIIAICVAIWSVVTVFTALANGFVTLLISRAVLGIGEAGYYPAGTAMLSDYFSRSKRAQIMSRWTAGSLIGLMIGFIAGGVIAGLGYGKWRLAFLFTGIPGLLLAFLSYRLREPRRNQADEESVEVDPHYTAHGAEAANSAHAVTVPKSVVKQFGLLLRIRTLVVLIIMQIFAYFSLGAVVYLNIYLQQKDTYGLSSGFASILAGGVVVIAGVLGVLIGGYMADILNRHHPGARVLVCGIGFLLCAPAFALAVTIHNEAVFIVCFFITALLINVYNGPSTAATQDVVPSALRASAIALSLLAAHLLGDAFSPSLVGVLAKSFDPTPGKVHFAQSMAGHDLSLALLITCVPTLVIAGVVGIIGARWMKADMSAAERADKEAQERGLEEI